MEEYRLKPISKKALISCVEQTMFSPWRERVVELIKEKSFASMRLKPGPGPNGHTFQEAMISQEEALDYTSYCGDSIYAAIAELLRGELDIPTLHMLSFPNTVRIPETTPPYTEAPPETGNTPSDEAP